MNMYLLTASFKKDRGAIVVSLLDGFVWKEHFANMCHRNKNISGEDRCFKKIDLLRIFRWRQP